MEAASQHCASAARRWCIEHMESENQHRFDVSLGTFDHPRYELVPTGEVFDGAEEVTEYYRRTREAFPDQRNENTVLHHADDAVIVEFDLLGTHEGELRGIAPTGRSFRCRMCALFIFEPGRRPHQSASASTSTRRRSPSSCSATAAFPPEASHP